MLVHLRDCQGQLKAHLSVHNRGVETWMDIGQKVDDRDPGGMSG